jgi:hypothetical protein
MPSDLWPQIVLGGVVAAAIGAIVAGRISRSIKISEFRQAWINDLRKDIAKYVGVSHEWIRRYEQYNDLDASEQEERARMDREELSPIHNEALVILSRIKLRFNPLKNRYKKDDDKFLSTLDNLLDPSKPAPRSEVSSLETNWLKLANEAVETARVILKREWEITKQPGQWF